MVKDLNNKLATTVSYRFARHTKKPQIIHDNLGLNDNLFSSSNPKPYALNLPPHASYLNTYFKMLLPITILCTSLVPS